MQEISTEIKIESQRKTGSINPTILFLSSARAHLHSAKVVGLPQSELDEQKQKIVQKRIDEIYANIGNLLVELKDPYLGITLNDSKIKD